jgi:hypothetical protein
MNPHDKNRNESNPDSAAHARLPQHDRSGVDETPGSARDHEMARSGNRGGVDDLHKTWSPRQGQPGTSTLPNDAVDLDSDEMDGREGDAVTGEAATRAGGQGMGQGRGMNAGEIHQPSRDIDQRPYEQETRGVSGNSRTAETERRSHLADAGEAGEQTGGDDQATLEAGKKRKGDKRQTM